MLAADNILSFIRDHVVLVSIIKKIASKTSGLHPSLSTNWKEHFDFFVSVWCCLRIHEEKKRRISFPISNPRFQEPTSPVEKIRNPGPAKWVDKEVNQENIHKIFFDEYCCCGPGKKKATDLEKSHSSLLKMTCSKYSTRTKMLRLDSMLPSVCSEIDHTWLNVVTSLVK